MRSRKKPIQYCVGLIALALLFFFLGLVPSKGLLAFLLLAAGLGAGYMVLFVTNAAEQLGFLGRVMHGRNPRTWLRELRAKIGEPVDYSLAVETP